MIIARQSKPTLTPFNLNHGDRFHFKLSDGRTWDLELLQTNGEILSRGPVGGAARDTSGGKKLGDIASYGFSAHVRINGKEFRLHRVVGSQESFYEPWNINGVNLWFDAASCAFELDGGFMAEKDWRAGYVCQPDGKARFAVQEASRPICPGPVVPWYPDSSGRIDIRNCYNGEDCWMGPYSGGSAHCGLDVNMPAGTILTAPIDFDDHYLFNSVEAGYGNNRWRGVRRWPDGSEWQLQCHHQVLMLVPERTPLTAGTPYATGAGTAVGSHEHSHFMFRVIDHGGQYWLDPWILFWEIFRRQRKAA